MFVPTRSRKSMKLLKKRISAYEVFYRAWLLSFCGKKHQTKACATYCRKCCRHSHGHSEEGEKSEDVNMKSVHGDEETLIVIGKIVLLRVSCRGNQLRGRLSPLNTCSAVAQTKKFCTARQYEW